MQKFYFFATTRERNAQGEYWTLLKPLSGQTTFQGNEEVPVNENLKVQVPATENRKVVRIPTGAIVGVKYTGNTHYRISLPLRRRGETNYYRTEQELFLVRCLGTLGNPDIISQADDEMMQAFHQLRNHEAQDSTTPATSTESAESASPASTAEPAGQTATEIPLTPQTRVDNIEIRAIENFLLNTLDERAAILKLLTVSRIKDRMRAGVAKFSFVKQNGDVRIAYGTRNPALLSLFSTNTVDGHLGEPDGNHFNYFDIQRRSWRCFCTPDVKSVIGEAITNMETIQQIASQPVAIAD